MKSSKGLKEKSECCHRRQIQYRMAAVIAERRSTRWGEECRHARRSIFLPIAAPHRVRGQRRRDEGEKEEEVFCKVCNRAETQVRCPGEGNEGQRSPDTALMFCIVAVMPEWQQKAAQ